MFQPSTPESRPEAVSIAADRETVIKFVISGPYLNAEARAEPARESDAATDLQALLGRIGELEQELRDERSRVDALCRALTAGKPRDAEPAAAERLEPAGETVSQPRPPVEPVAAPAFTLSAIATPATAAPVAAAPVAAAPVATAPLHPLPSAPPAPALAPVSIAPVTERVRAHTFHDAPEPVTPPKLHALSTAAPPQPPKVRGLRRMIGALRHL
jgi:hypothetical protein